MGLGVVKGQERKKERVKEEERKRDEFSHIVSGDRILVCSRKNV